MGNGTFWTFWNTVWLGIITFFGFLCLWFSSIRCMDFAVLIVTHFLGDDAVQCSCLFFFWLEDTTYGIIRHNFYTFGPLSYRRNDGIWSSSQIMYGLWPKFFHFVPTFHLIGTIHGIMTHWSDCVISHSSDSFVWSKSISQMLWKFKSLEQKIALELLKKN